MSDTASVTGPQFAATPRLPPRRARLRPRVRCRPSVAAAVIVLAVLAVAAIRPSLFTNVNPDAANPVATLLSPRAGHWFGTDQNGRDLYARVVYGTRASLLIGLSASAIALAAGVAVGTVAAAGGRVIDQVIGRALDSILSIPGLLLAFLAIAVAGSGTQGEVAGLALMTFPGYARLTHGEVLRLRRSPFTEAAWALGWSRLQVAVRHVIPNALGPTLALATLGVGSIIVVGSSLSFLGFGPQPPAAEWGAMLAASQDYLSVAWWTGVFPGAAITVTVIAITVAGQALQRLMERREAQ